MVIIKPYQTAISLFHKDGTVRFFASLAEARKALGYSWIAAHVGKNFSEFSHISNLCDGVHERQAIYAEFDWVMRNDFGEAVTADDFYRVRVLRSYNRFGPWSGVGAVPGTRKSRGGRRMRRRIKTLSERRDCPAVLDDGEVAPRASRNATNLPTSWDVPYKWNTWQRTWKDHRKTQWKSQEKTTHRKDEWLRVCTGQ